MMHDDVLALGFYWACAFPERPDTRFTCYDDACPKCMVMAQAAVANGAGGVTGLVGQGHGKMSLKEFVELKRG